AREICVASADPPVGTSIKRAYFERLVQSDLSGPVRKALDRRDPATAALFAAIGAFLVAGPAETLAPSTPLVELALDPPGRRWRDLVPSARASYWTILRPAVRA